jgi:O-antigen/teichoic acid export membrane protein
MSGFIRRLFAYATSAYGIYLLSSFLAKAGALVLIPLYTRKLSVEAYGDYALALTLSGIAPIFLSLGTVAAVGTFYFLGEDLELAKRKSGAAARACIIISVTLGAVTQVGILLFAGRDGGIGSARILSYLLWAGVGVLLGGIPSVYLRAQQRPLAAAGYQLFQFGTSIAAAIVFVVILDRGLDGAIVALAWAGVATGVVGVAFILLRMPGRLTLALLRESVRFSFPFVPHYASMQITSISDRWVMKAASRDFDLGSYSLAITVTGPVGMLQGAWNEAESPKLGELMRSGGARAVQKGFARVLAGYALVAFAPGVLLVACLPILRAIVGGRFEQALWPVPVIAFLMVLETPFSPSVNIFSYFERTRIIPVITMTCALLHFGANVLLIPRWGTAGALAARGLIAIVRSTTMIWFSYDTMRRKERERTADSG